jgi:hypothetical protein
VVSVFCVQIRNCVCVLMKEMKRGYGGLYNTGKVLIFEGLRWSTMALQGN